jgi:transcriptional regulator with PAS, ATPase and Fis domain
MRTQDQALVVRLQAAKKSKTADVVHEGVKFFIPLHIFKKVDGLIYVETQENKELTQKAQAELFAQIGKEISSIIEKDFEIQQKQKKVEMMQNSLSYEKHFLGISPKTTALIKSVEKYSEHDVKILILGETGTGKNLIAEHIHNCSKRRGNDFVEINCAAIPEGVLESEMFGVIANYPGFHNPVALKGKFQIADKGTLFLNEIGELPLRLQAKLLQALDNNMIWPLGAEKPIEINVRIITATNRNLEQDVQKHNFRMDLYNRLNVVTIESPPLHERKDDIVFLAGYFLCKLRDKYAKRIYGFSADCVSYLNSYDWPGNIRELYAAVERAVVNTDDGIIVPQRFHLSQHLGVQPETLNEIEKDHIIKVLKYTGGNVTKASKILGITKTTLYNKGKEYDLPEF